jgi:molybdate transport system substrate-binding protein
MRNGITAALTAAILAAALLATGLARADELKLLSAASMQTVFKEIIGDFERESGHKVSLRYSTMGAITGRVAGGESADLVISSPGSIASLVSQGKVDPASTVTIAKTGVAGVVPAGDPVPFIASEDDFKRALLAAKAVVYANPAGGGAAGIHIGKLIERFGLTDALKAKTRLAAGGDVFEVTIALGSGALGLTQVSEVVGKAGGQIVTIPEAFQNYTGFVAATPVGVKKSEASESFVQFLRSPRALEVMKEKGMKVD